jgi:hypothetical protein
MRAVRHIAQVKNNKVSLQIILPDDFNANTVEVILLPVTEYTGDKSNAVAGKPLSVKEYKTWIEQAENEPSKEFNEVKTRWESRKKQLRVKKEK